MAIPSTVTPTIARLVPRPPNMDPGTYSVLLQQSLDALRKASDGFPATVDIASVLPLVFNTVAAQPRSMTQGPVTPQLIAAIQQRIGYNPQQQTTNAQQAITDLGTQPKTEPQPPPPTAPGAAPEQPFSPAMVAMQILQSAAQNAPNPSDPKYSDPAYLKSVGASDGVQAYQNDYLTWQSILQNAATVSKSMNDLSAGIIDVGGGRYITQAQFDALSPQEQTQVAAVYQQKNATTTNQYNQMVNQLGLDQYKAGNEAVSQNNAALSAQFQNKLAAVNQQISLGNADVAQAVDDVSRFINGLQESRQRATDITTAEKDAAPLGAPAGQTAFTPTDLGSAITGLARLGGAQPNVPLLQFTGQRTVNPAGLMAQGDQALGVSGQLPTIPNPFTNIKPMTPGAVPQPTMVGAPPAMQPYSPIPQLPIPSPRNVYGDPALG